MSRSRAWFASALVLSLVAARASAGNDDGILIGSQGARLGGAVTAIVKDGTAVWYNPGAIGKSGEQTLDLTGTLLEARYTLVSGFLRAQSGPRSDAKVLELFAAPSTLVHQVPLGGGVGLAYGIFTTRRESGFTQASLDGATAAELEEWHLALSRDMQRYDLGVGIAAPLRRDVRLGASLFAVYETESSTAQFLGGPPGNNGQSVTIVSQAFRASLGGELALGLEAEPQPGWYFGATAYTPLVLFATSIDRLDSTEITRDDGTGQLSRTRDVQTQGNLATEITISSPFRFRCGLAHDMGPVLVSLDADIQAPLDQPELQIQREAVPNFRVGADYAWSDTTTVGGGLFTDLAANRKDTTVVDFFGMTLGLATRTRHRLAEHQSADFLDFTAFVAGRYALGVGKTDGLRVNPITDPEPFTNTQARTWVHELGLNVGTGVEF